MAVTRLNDWPILTVQPDAIRPGSSPQRKAMDQCWQEARRHHPGLTNGRLYGVRHYTAEKLVIAPMAYADWWVCYHHDEFAESTAPLALAVSGVIETPHGYLCGRRADNVTQHPGCWELVPSGGVEVQAQPTSAVELLAGQLSTELHEETGLQLEQATSLTPYALIETRGCLDVVIGASLPVSAAEIRRRSHNKKQEYSVLDILTFSEMIRMLESGQTELFVPTSKEILLSVRKEVEIKID